MERWNPAKKEFMENPAIDAFIEDVLAVCKRHGFSIGHEDGHGAFEIGAYGNDGDADWLRNAKDMTGN